MCGGKMDAKRMPVNRLFVGSGKDTGKGAMPVCPLKRQLRAAVVIHNSVSLFSSEHAWFHKNREQLGVLFQGLSHIELGLGHLLGKQE